MPLSLASTKVLSMQARRTTSVIAALVFLFAIVAVQASLRLPTSRVPFPRPETRQHDLLEAWLDAALVEPGVQSGFDELGDLGHVL